MKQGRRAQKCRIWGKATKILRSSCTPRRYCESWFWILCSIHWTGIISISKDSSKRHGYHIQTVRVRRTSSWRSICLYPGKKWKMLQKLLKIPKSKCPDIWIRLLRHKWPKSWSSIEDPVVPLERNLYGHPLAGLLWERQFAKVLLEHCWESFKMWMLICHPSKRTFPIRVCGRYQTGRQDRKHRSDLENSHGRRWLGRTNIISWPCIFGLHSTRISN